MNDLFDVDELALVRSSRPIALTVSPAGALGVVEVTAGVITEVVGGPHVDTVSSGHGIGFWFNAIDQHRHPVNKMATLLLFATAGLAAREAPLLYGPVLVASHDATGQPAGLSKTQIKMLRHGPKVTWRTKWRYSGGRAAIRGDASGVGSLNGGSTGVAPGRWFTAFEAAESVDDVNGDSAHQLVCVCSGSLLVAG